MTHTFLKAMAELEESFKAIMNEATRLSHIDEPLRGKMQRLDALRQSEEEIEVNIAKKKTMLSSIEAQLVEKTAQLEAINKNIESARAIVNRFVTGK